MDIDPDIIRIAENEFGIKNGENLKIECDDALDYLKKDNRTFDLVIVDLFLDNKVPDKFLSVIFWENIRKKIASGGYLIFNSIRNINTNIEPVKERLSESGLKVKEYNEVEGTNRILIGNLPRVMVENT